MNRFSETVPLVLTPLTPIHIGCGEDFEPTNYIIDNGVLYGFEPSRLGLTSEDRERLIQYADRAADAAVRGVQQFFHERRHQCRAISHLALPVAIGVAQRYERRIGQVAQRESGGRTVINRLEIERTAHHPYSDKPYLPGSSIKGSARTAWLNAMDNIPPIRCNPGQPPRKSASDLEKEILGGSFVSDPFRLVEFADAAGADLKSRVVFAVDRRKSEGKENNVAIREVIVAGQHRAAQGEIRFKMRPPSSDPDHAPRVEKCIGDFAALARACNRFYRGRLAADLEVLTGLGETQWADAFKSLIAALGPALDDGRAMLLRVGRHSGAESVTLERHRCIRILEGPGRAHWARDATTIWLAAEREDARTGLRLFGWLLVEQADKLLKGQHLERWCNAEKTTVAETEATGRRSAAPAPASKPAQSETVWDRARLQYNRQNGTLTAFGPQNARATALGPRGTELFASLPAEVQRQVQANPYSIRVVARVRGSELMAVEVGS